MAKLYIKQNSEIFASPNEVIRKHCNYKESIKNMLITVNVHVIVVYDIVINIV